MKHNIQYELINELYVDDAVDLVLSAYKEEKISVSFLPDEQELLKYLQESIANLFRNGTGIVAICNNRLIGFLAGFEANEFFGKCRGIYSPLYGHGVLKEYRSSLFNELYKHVAKMWVEMSCMTHAITLFAHDKKSIDKWFWMGFGLRCVDAIREISPIDSYNQSIDIKKVDDSHIPILADIHRKHNQYYRTSPIFMPNIEEDPIQDLTEWLEKQNHHIWVAYCDEKPVGYMRIQPNAESFISKHHNIMNITGAYVLNDERKSGIGAMLLDETQKWLLQNKYPLCGVDFESLNISGSSFWNKYFTPYTYSMVRRIDERIKE